MILPTGNLSNHINTVFILQATEVDDHCGSYDLLE